MVNFQVVSWHSEDNEQDEYVITMYGRTQDHKSVACMVPFEPYFYVEETRDYVVQGKLYDKSIQLGSSVSVSVVKRKKFFGFTNDKWFTFVKVKCPSKNIMKSAQYALSNHYKNRLYETNIDPLLRFVHVQNLETTGWVRCEGYSLIEDEDKTTHCDVEILCDSYLSVTPLIREDTAPIVIASFDIETYSADGSFPDAKNPECPIIQIATTYQRYGETEPFSRELITLNKCNSINDVNITECAKEVDLIKQWCSEIHRYDPDIIVGYNIWKFDLAYIYERAKDMDSFTINRCKIDSTIYNAKFSSSAYGDNEYKMVSSIGRMQIDLLELYKREHKLVSYSLNNVSQHFLKETKNDLPIKEMFQRYRNGTAEDMKVIGEYCVQDTNLPLRLMHKLSNIPNLIEMAKVTYVPMNYLIERGQQIKVFSQIAKETLKNDMLIVTLYDNKSNESFTGATVLDAKKGAYMDEVVTGLDFASLYPSIMRAHNLCYNTIVKDSKYDNIDGIEYETVEWTTKTGQKLTYRFAQTTQGILPKLLENLAKSRKQAKKDMANAKDSFVKNMYNGKQLAFKVSMNSIYGFCAAFMLPCQEISACVTTIGRNMIEKTKSLVEEWYPGSRVVYGDTDSVMVVFSNDLKESFRLGEEAAERISNTFKKPIELEFEKCYSPYLLFSKKRYAGLMYTQPDKPDYIDAKGIQLVRRDNPEFVRDVSKEVLNIIMYEKDVRKAEEVTKKAGKTLLNGEVPIEKLTVSKSLRKDYKNTNQPHIHVAKKIELRQPGGGPKSGERVPYVFVYTGNHKDLQYQKAEDPSYVKEHKIPLDLMYYMEHSLTSPLESLFELFMKNPAEYLFKSLKDEYVKHTNNKHAKEKKQNMISCLTNGMSTNNVVETTPHVVIKRTKCKGDIKDKSQRRIDLFFT